jgi:hypothetical protein
VISVFLNSEFTFSNNGATLELFFLIVSIYYM